MALPETDLDAFFDDELSVVVEAGAVSGRGIFDVPDLIVGDGLVMSTEYTLLIKTSEFGSLARGDTVTVDGDEYTVREAPRKIDDGKLSRILLSLDD